MDQSDATFYEKILAEMDTIDNPLYKPTSFWNKALCEIRQELKGNNIIQFRNLKKTKQFFVPTYAIEGLNYFPIKLIQALEENLKKQDSMTKKSLPLLNKLKNGHHLAYADYRTFKAGDIKSQPPYLHNCSESFIGCPTEQFTFENKKYSRSMLNYLNGLVFLKHTIDTSSIKKVLEIGGGFGTLGEILLNDTNREYKYVNIDIPPASYTSSYYLQKLYKKRFKSCFDYAFKTITLDNNDFGATVLNTWQLPKLKGEFDLFVNFISFQEMEPDVIKNYIHHIKRLKCKYILIRNIKEGKASKEDNMNKALVKIPVTSDFYISAFAEKNYQLLASNIIPYGFTTCDGFNSELLIFELKE